MSWFCVHFFNITPFVTKGQSIAAGQVIAKVGATGRVTGAHLHLGVLVNGEEVNPREYISQ